MSEIKLTYFPPLDFSFYHKTRTLEELHKRWDFNKHKKFSSGPSTVDEMDPKPTWFDKLLEFFDFSYKTHKGNFVWEGNKVVFKRCKYGKFTCTKSGNTTNITIN
jgi:hypothetical protein